MRTITRFRRWLADERVQARIVKILIALFAAGWMVVCVFWHPILWWIWCVVLKQMEGC